ncbi:related to uracil permease [Cephalotrichum gorgonifer]|uniref:Related to uracil permease n=1 Tax=Cephalotrichum gorgonifer TaxID=2041049 RepID=A0AAE8SZP4_9PEZI|nr:related to uracil permease [Cephalotrichum gorgonifer]
MDFHSLRQRGQAKAQPLAEKTKLRLTRPSSWKLPKQNSSIAPPDVWTNADQGVPRAPGETHLDQMDIPHLLVQRLGHHSDLERGLYPNGLSATDAVLIVLVAGICNAIPTVLNGCIGSDLHIPFPIAARASYGYWLSYFCVISRGILALFWFGVNSAGGGDCVTAIILAIWPSYANIPNHLPARIGVTPQGMCSYLIYWLLQFPLLLVPTHKLQYMFNVKAVLTLPMALAMVIWISVKAGGGGQFFSAPATVSGSTRSWLRLSSLTSVTGGYSTLAVNIPDFSRFSKESKAPYWQLPFIPFLKTIVGLFGIVAASASRELYGEALWNPIDIVNKWQGSSGGRAAAFFCGVIWLLAQISVNISANSISFANDITNLNPKWFNIRRGTIFAALAGGWALCPWIIMASASAFLSFMSAYAIFMGVNWHALVTTLVVIVPLLPGLGNKVTPENVQLTVGLQHLFSFNWLYGYFMSIFLYYVLNFFFPDKGTLIEKTVPGFDETIDGVEADTESRGTDDRDEKGPRYSTAKEVPVSAMV